MGVYPSPWGSIAVSEEDMLHWRDSGQEERLAEIVSAVGVYTAYTVAFAYCCLGLRPIPLCDPGHEHVSRAHCEGYKDREGKWHGPCKSPGKGPIEARFPRFSRDFATIDELHRMFDRHKGNIGTAVMEGYAVADIDPRSGGNESLLIYEATHGRFPETPMQITGSGGLHIWLRLPEGLRLGGGHSLGSAGYPGMEFKSAGGQVALSPSIHPSGQPYQWEASALPGLLTAAPAPQAFLDLALFDPIRRAAPSSPDGSHGRMSTEQVRALFGAMYSEGERRSGHGLPRLVGVLRSRGVDVDTAVNFLSGWQQEHFAPPLSDEEIDAHVRAMYDRYGHPAMEKAPQGNRFLGWLGVALAGKQSTATNVQETRIEETPYTGFQHISHDEAADEDRAAREERKAAERAENKQAIDLFPKPDGIDPRTYAAYYFKVEDPWHTVKHWVYSKTWQNPANVAIRRRMLWKWYRRVFQGVEEAGGGIYRGARKLGADTKPEDMDWARRYRARIKRAGGHFLQLLTQRGEDWYVVIFSDEPDGRGGEAEVPVDAQEDLITTLQGCSQPPWIYGWKHPVICSPEWRMNEARTGEWEYLGKREVFTEEAERNDDMTEAQKAAAAGIRTYVATEEELLARSPGAIQHSRHFRGDPNDSPERVYLFHESCGVKIQNRKLREQLEKLIGGRR